MEGYCQIADVSERLRKWRSGVVGRNIPWVYYGLGQFNSEHSLVSGYTAVCYTEHDSMSKRFDSGYQYAGRTKWTAACKQRANNIRTSIFLRLYRAAANVNAIWLDFRLPAIQWRIGGSRVSRYPLFCLGALFEKSIFWKHVVAVFSWTGCFVFTKQEL